MTVTTPERIRPRRLRRTPAIRELVAETAIAPSQLIMPHFVLPQGRGNEPIPSMPGIELQGIETCKATIESDLKLGIRSVLLFGHPEAGTKSPTGDAAAVANGAVQQAVASLKAAFGDDRVCAATRSRKPDRAAGERPSEPF